MGFVSGECLRIPGMHLLNILKAEGSVRYSRFYGPGTEIEDLAKQLREMGDDNSQLDEHAHVIIEFAAHQMKRRGIVTFTVLDDDLIDGEKDFLIALTDKGKAFVASGQDFPHWDMDL